MVCKTCSAPGVLNTVLNKDFYYCRTCKTEITLEAPPLAQEFVDLSPTDEEAFKAWIDSVNQQIDASYDHALSNPAVTIDHLQGVSYDYTCYAC